jgi:fatty acid desaturase
VDHRKSCRTYITRGLPAFLYWNMQYHIEHHMYPGVPFYNLPKLRKAIEHDLPPAPNGLWATWKELLAIHRKQKDDPDYFMEVELPESHGAARASVDDLGGEMSVA